MQAAAIASALVECEKAHVYRSEIREWLDRIDRPTGGVVDDMEEGRGLALFFTNLVRIGEGLRGVDD